MLGRAYVIFAIAEVADIRDGIKFAGFLQALPEVNLLGQLEDMRMLVYKTCVCSCFVRK